MLVSDAHKFYIVTPSKCGTNSLHALAAKWQRSGGSPAVLRRGPHPRHRLAPPPGGEKYTRAMMVRDPYKRLRSMFKFHLNVAQQWGHREAAAAVKRARDESDAFTMWLEWFADQRAMTDARPPEDRREFIKAPFIWTDTLATQLMAVQGVGSDGETRLPWFRPRRVAYVHLEDVVAKGLWAAWSQVGWDGQELSAADLSALPAVNRSGGGSVAFVPGRQVRLLKELCDEDARAFGYPVLGTVL